MIINVKQVSSNMKNKFEIRVDNKLKVYDVSVGKTRNILIYNNDIQIAEIIKPLVISNNLDNYYIFLLDKYIELESIISFFTIYFDYQNYSNTGEFVKNKEDVSIRCTYDKNNKFYDKNWIYKYFNGNDVNNLYNEMEKNRKESINKIKHRAKYILLSIAISWIIILVIIGILFFKVII